MALVVKIEDGAWKVAFWQLTEEVDALIHSEMFTDDDRREFLLFHHDKRKREFVASRAALRIGLSSAEPVLYEPTGKPYLASSPMSMSHCLPIAGALLHATHAGFDIQQADQKLHTIRHRFSHPTELKASLQSQSELDYLTILWSAKEAIFKVFGENLTFATDILVRPFSVGDSTIVSDVSRGNTSYLVNLRVFKVCEVWVVVVHSVAENRA